MRGHAGGTQHPQRAAAALKALACLIQRPSAAAALASSPHAIVLGQLLVHGAAVADHTLVLACCKIVSSLAMLHHTRDAWAHAVANSTELLPVLAQV